MIVKSAMLGCIGGIFISLPVGLGSLSSRKG